ncbi:MAG: methyltransferase domain-containing protein [Nanoarchaeota archaeon]
MKKALISTDGSHFLVDTDKDFHCRDGMISKDVIAKEGKFTAKNGVTFHIFDASFTDLFLHLKRGAQIVLPKDIGTIIAESGINKHSIVIDAGTGSGALTSYLALHAKKVYTFDNRKEHIEVAAKNFTLFGLKNIVAKEHDMYAEDVPVKNADLVTLDLTEPWRAVPHIEKAMKPGGFLIAYNPQISQAITLVNSLKENKGFMVIKVLENMQREWEIDGHISRPRFNQIAHTGFLTIARKIS